jgi:hypothetical protein
MLTPNFTAAQTEKIAGSGCDNSLECAGLAALWPVATCRGHACLSCFNDAATSRRGPKRRRAAALQRVDHCFLKYVPLQKNKADRLLDPPCLLNF